MDKDTIKVKKKRFSILGIIALFLVLSFCLFLYWSPGRIEQFTDEKGNVIEGSIAEVVRLKIGDVEQGMIIRGKSDKNPVLLFLHGGPGAPAYMEFEESGLMLEDHFTVCWWEQRGSGMSFNSSIPPDTMTIQQLILDTVEVTKYLQTRFGQEKIYLMGHSWGSFLGIQTASEYPELYEAYIGIGQIVNKIESEKLAIEYMLNQAKTKGDIKLENELSQFSLDDPNTVIRMDYTLARTNAMNKFGIGYSRDPDKVKSVFMERLSLLTCRAYTIPDKIKNSRGIFFTNKNLYPEIIKYNISETVQKLDVPIYIIHGAYDFQVSYKLSREYFDTLEAPYKQFYTFDNSAHRPYIDEPEKFMEILTEEVIAGKK